jgi:hypothetical protein
MLNYSARYVTEKAFLVKALIGFGIGAAAFGTFAGVVASAITDDFETIAIMAAAAGIGGGIGALIRWTGKTKAAN